MKLSVIFDDNRITKDGVRTEVSAGRWRLLGANEVDRIFAGGTP